MKWILNRTRCARRHSLLRPIVALCLAGSPLTPALAQWSSASGRITSTYVSQANNFSFRVSLRNGGVDALASCNDSFAFINTSDDNYQAKVGAFLSAAAAQQQVDIFYTRNAAGWCTITDLRVIY